MRNFRGFSLFEMLMTLTIIAILTAIGVPFYFKMMEHTQETLVSSQLLQAIALARHEAIGSGSVVALEPLGNWHKGYVIRTGSKVLHTFELKGSGILHWRERLGEDAIHFDASHLGGVNNGTFWYCSTNTGKPAWAIVLNHPSRARLVYPDRAGEIMDGEGQLLVC